jgi:CIC family chloride channel protein
MEKTDALPDPDRERPSGLIALTALALVAGAAAGGVGAAFRVLLEAADRLRDLIIARAHAAPIAGFLLVVAACGAATLVAAWLVRRFSPHAAGSGVPHVEAVLRFGLPPAPYALAPVKFGGGVLAIGAVLGREGPTVQIGASIAVMIGRALRLPWRDCRALLAAGAGAGLATAFNAPFAGAAFVLEELIQSFDPRIAVAALAASATAISVVRAALGDAPDFLVAALPSVPTKAHPLFFVLGAGAGLAAVAYNRTLVATIAAVERVPLPQEARAGLIGAGVGALGFAWPGVVGGGDPITGGALAGGGSLTLVAVMFAVRFGLGAISYAAATPGGLFAPLLTLGAEFGLLFGAGCQWAFPAIGAPAASFALVGMAAFFTGVVRAPLTGMVLISEMTGNVTLLLPMLGACAFAMLAPALLRSAPIYDTLRETLLRRERAAVPGVNAGKADGLAADPGARVSPDRPLGRETANGSAASRSEMRS